MSFERESKRMFVQQQLLSYSGQKKKLPDSTFICCPFHSEKTPSARIFHGPQTRSPGILKCYGCGHTAKWDDFARMIGLQPYKSNGKPTSHFFMPMDVEVEEDKDDPYYTTDLPRDKSWRGISTNLLIDVGCKFYHNKKYPNSKFIWMPVYVKRELRGFIKARMKKDPDRPSYINSKTNWTSVYGYFPFDYAIKMAQRWNRIVLVEGQRDALRLLKYGIPAVAILGTQSWSDKKARLLDLFGIKSVVTMLDGDPAGIKGTRLAVKYLEKYYKVHTVALWKIKGNPYPEWKTRSKKEQKATKGELWDPGSMPVEIIKKLKRKYFP